jgi:hypothetical protein
MQEHGGDDDHVVALQKRPGRRVAHPVDLLVDGGFLLDVGVRARDVGLRLVVVVVGDEILHRVVGEERLELAVELGGERLVGGENEGRALGVGDHLRHREGFSRPGDPQKHLVALLAADAVHELGDGRRLVARGLELGLQREPLAALPLLRTGRPVGRPQLAVLEERVALREEAGQRLDGARDPLGGERGTVARILAPVRAVVRAPKPELLRPRRIDVGGGAVGEGGLRGLGEAARTIVAVRARLRSAFPRRPLLPLALPVEGGVEAAPPGTGRAASAPAWSPFPWTGAGSWALWASLEYGPGRAGREGFGPVNDRPFAAARAWEGAISGRCVPSALALPRRARLNGAKSTSSEAAHRG